MVLSPATSCAPKKSREEKKKNPKGKKIHHDEREGPIFLPITKRGRESKGKESPTPKGSLFPEKGITRTGDQERREGDLSRKNL